MKTIYMVWRWSTYSSRASLAGVYFTKRAAQKKAYKIRQGVSGGAQVDKITINGSKSILKEESF